MRRALCLVVLLVAGPAAAQEKPKPNTLTPKEIADGWLMLFDGETKFGWKIEEGTAVAKNGGLVIGGEKATKLMSTTAFPGVHADITFHTADGKPAAGGLIRQGETSLKFANNIRAEHNIPWTGWKKIREPFVIEVPAGQVVILDRLTVRPVNTDENGPIELPPLFNGKDLTGWKVFPGEKYKSKFAVTPAGELSVKDGPGDLQTDKVFGDFVLQLECKTNGKALNSGVFFRCLADQYQQGYEAQIQNAFFGDDRTKPADFGTGAIYRRVTARKVVSSDNEWFTMTVVADGKHVSTWVNGYQTVDWTDDRPAEENARKGYRAGKGHLSIQGHDPTTDILFRNIRVAELGK